MRDKTGDKIQILENKLALQGVECRRAINELLQPLLFDCFRFWADRYPKRRLSCVWGMGTNSFDAGKIDLFYLLGETRGRNYRYRIQHEELLKPFIEFSRLIEEPESFPYLADTLYNPITRTIEYGTTIIQLELPKAAKNGTYITSQIRPNEQ